MARSPGERLADAAVENERALRVGRAATERLIAAIVNAVKQSRRPLTGYAPRRNTPTRAADRRRRASTAGSRSAAMSLDVALQNAALRL